jgi:uncharacterized protein YegJ (DUF2314 family)
MSSNERQRCPTPLCAPASDDPAHERLILSELARTLAVSIGRARQGIEDDVALDTMNEELARFPMDCVVRAPQSWRRNDKWRPSLAELLADVRWRAAARMAALRSIERALQDCRRCCEKRRAYTAGMKSMRIIPVLSALCLALAGDALAQTALERARRDEIVNVPAGDAAMEAAFAKARATLDGFLALLAAPPPNTRTYALKIRITDPGRNDEFFWVTDLKRNGDRFSGQINNTPRSVTNVRLGQVVEFGRGEIYDWMYVDERLRRMMGNFTLCALLAREKPEDAASLKRKTGIVCD